LLATSLLGRIGGIALPLALLLTPQAQAQENCMEVPGPGPPANVNRLAELQANAARATFTVPLDSSRAAQDDITLPVKGNENVGTSERDATARLEPPRRNNRRLRADVRVAATPTELGTGIVVCASISNKGRWEAGTYAGTVQIYGPRFSEFSYPLVVTTKWPVFIPVGIILVVLLFFAVLEIIRQETGTAGNVIYLIIALGAGALTYFGQYNAVDTWGDKPEIQLAGLAVAVVTAGATGRAAAKKFFGGGG
jgi:hypothetical protein